MHFSFDLIAIANSFLRVFSGWPFLGVVIVSTEE